MNEKVGAAAFINRHFQNGETTCRQLSKRLLDNSTIFAAEATAISLALNYYQHMDPVHHDVILYSDSMSCLQAIEGEDTENPFICHIMNLLWSLSDKGTRVRFCWVPSHCGIDGNERVDQLAKETLDQDIDPLASVHYTDMKPLVNSYIQKLVQTKWDIAVHGRDLYLVKPTLGPPKKFQHLTRAEEVVITRLRIGHTKVTKYTCVRFCWVPSHCGIEGDEIVDQLAKESLDHDIDPLTTVHFADLKPLDNSYIQQEVQIKWDVSIHGRDLYLLKPTLGPPKRFRHLTRAEDVVITRLRIGHTKATKSHILSRGPPTACQHCGQTLDNWARAPGVCSVAAKPW